MMLRNIEHFKTKHHQTLQEISKLASKNDKNHVAVALSWRIPRRRYAAPLIDGAYTSPQDHGHIGELQKKMIHWQQQKI
jgi:hypothetical protein